MLQRIRIKNRRKRYLDTHPDYFSPSLELAGLPTALNAKSMCANTMYSAVVIRQDDQALSKRQGARSRGPL